MSSFLDLDLFSNWKDRILLKQASKWGKGRAETKLRVFNAYKTKFPEMANKELYYLTVLAGLDFTETTAQEVIDMVEGKLGDLHLPYTAEPMCLRNVVKCMLIFEEYYRFGDGGFPHPYGIPEAFLAVDAVIPANL